MAEGIGKQEHINPASVWADLDHSLQALTSAYYPGESPEVSEDVDLLVSHALSWGDKDKSDGDIIAEMRGYFIVAAGHHLQGLDAEMAIALARRDKNEAAEFIENPENNFVATEHRPFILIALAEGYARNRFDIDAAFRYLEKAHVVSLGFKPDHLPYIDKAFEAIVEADTPEGWQARSQYIRSHLKYIPENLV